MSIIGRAGLKLALVDCLGFGMWDTYTWHAQYMHDSLNSNEFLSFEHSASKQLCLVVRKGLVAKNSFVHMTQIWNLISLDEFGWNGRRRAQEGPGSSQRVIFEWSRRWHALVLLAFIALIDSYL